jgi:hypothetical protein
MRRCPVQRKIVATPRDAIADLQRDGGGKHNPMCMKQEHDTEDHYAGKLRVGCGAVLCLERNSHIKRVLFPPICVIKDSAI